MDEFCGWAMPSLKLDVTDEPGPAAELSYDDSPVLRNLGNGLLLAYIVDTGQSFEYVQNRHLSRAKATEDGLHATAMNNLLTFMGERTRMQPHSNIFAIFLDGNFEASLLLVDQLWDESLVGYAPNGFVVAASARDVLAFTDATSAAGIVELRGLVRRLFPGGDHLVSLELCKRQTGRWMRLEG